MVGVACLVSASAGADAMVRVAGDVAPTVAPRAVVPTTRPVVVTEPASTSACVTVYGAVQVVDAPGASVEVGQVIVSGGPAGAVSGPVTSIVESETLPVLRTRKDQVAVCPAAVAEAGLTDVVSATSGPCAVAMVTDDSFEGRCSPIGPTPVVTAVSLMLPLSRSAWVTVYVAAQVVLAAGASVVVGQDTSLSPAGSDGLASRSLTPTR